MNDKNTPKFTGLHRILHWTMAFSMLVLLITGFLRMYWMGKKAFFSAVNSQQEIEMTKDQAMVIYKSIRNPMWQWHELFANIMILAFIIRIIYMLVKGIRFPNPFQAKLAVKQRLQGLVYVYFYLYVFMASFTGVCMEYKLLSAYEDTFESAHKLSVYLFPIFVVLHFAGIALAENSTQKGITSKMIGGDK